MRFLAMSSKEKAQSCYCEHHLQAHFLRCALSGRPQICRAVGTKLPLLSSLPCLPCSCWSGGICQPKASWEAPKPPQFHHRRQHPDLPLMEYLCLRTAASAPCAARSAPIQRWQPAQAMYFATPASSHLLISMGAAQSPACHVP